MTHATQKHGNCHFVTVESCKSIAFIVFLKALPSNSIVFKMCVKVAAIPILVFLNVFEGAAAQNMHFGGKIHK